MSDLERGSRTRIHNIYLGKKWEPIQPAIDTIGNYGLSLDRETISYLRDRKYKGRLITEQLLAIGHSKQGNASAKDNMYLQVAEIGLALREETRSTIGRYSAKTLVPEIGVAISESDSVVRRLLRAMRTDLTSFDQANDDDGTNDIQNLFAQIVEKYVEAYRNPPSLRPKHFDILEEWNYQNIADFYKLLYPGSNTWTIATWIPYEVEAFANFYDYQTKRGHPFTPFDEFVLANTIENTLASKLVNKAKDKYPVPVSRIDIRLHRNLLLYGQLRVSRESYESS